MLTMLRSSRLRPKRALAATERRLVALRNKMKVERYIPTNMLKPFIKTLMIIESEDGTVNKVLPDTSIVLAFRHKGIIYTGTDNKSSLPTAAISGLTKSIRFFDYSKETATVLVVFNEGGATAFFYEPLHELFGLHISLDNLICHQKLNEIEDLLAEAKHNLQRISIIERFLLSILKEPQSDQLILKAIQKIKFANGDIRIKDLLTSLLISRDPFEKRFRRVIGTSPKQFAAIVRLRTLIDKYPQAKNLTDAALTTGYFDQAHFIKDFKSFTGQTPKDFFKSPLYW